MLPVELYVLIIGHLHDDKVTLKACSLTCRTFLHLSRYHLFHDVHLRGDFDAQRLLVTIGSTHSSTSPCTYIRNLFLYDRNNSWLNKVLPLLTTLLPNINHLKLRDISNDTQRATMLSAFQKVTSLDLEYCRFNTSAEMNELIASFPSLEYLCCPTTNWSEYAEPVIPLPQNIKKIILSGYQSTFFDQLLSLDPHLNVRAIEFSMLDVPFIKAVNKLLETLGSHLEDFKVGKISS
jgi:hypothetical protein